MFEHDIEKLDNEREIYRCKKCGIIQTSREVIRKVFRCVKEDEDARIAVGDVEDI